MSEYVTDLPLQEEELWKPHWEYDDEDDDWKYYPVAPKPGHWWASAYAVIHLKNGTVSVILYCDTLLSKINFF